MKYKNDPSHYPDWNVYNDPSGQKQPGRLRTDAIICRDSQCLSQGEIISEREAFYLFAKQGILKRLKPVFLPSKLKSLYVCPFCGKSDTLHPANNDISTY